MPTRAGWGVAVGAIVGVAMGRLLGVAELYVLAAVAGALVLAAVVWVQRPVPRLEIDRATHPSTLTAGAPARIEIHVANRGEGRSPAVSLLDPVEGTVGARLVIGPLAPGAGQDLGYRLPGLHRGLFHVGPLTAEVLDPFGLARRRLAGAAELVLTVLPAIDPAPLPPLGGGRHEPLAGLSRRAAAAAGAEDLVTLRPYVVGDDLRRVHWPSTAHADELQVRRDEERWQGHVAVLLDTRSGVLSEAEFERAVSVAAGIVDAVAASGDRVRLATTTGIDTGMVDAQRSAHGLLEDLALVRQVCTDRNDLPPPDPRRPVALLVLTSASNGGLRDALDGAGYPDPIEVCFGDDEPTTSTGRTVTVAPGEPFARAWQRSAAAWVHA